MVSLIRQADDSNLEQGASGAEAGPSKRPALRAAPKCALAAYALGSIHRKIPRQAGGAAFLLGGKMEGMWERLDVILGWVAW